MSDEKPKTALRELLEEGPVDKRIMASLDLLEELQAAVARKDSKATLEIGRNLATRAKEIKSAELERRSAMKTAVEKATAVSDPDARTAKLLDAFEFCAKTKAIANDEAGDRSRPTWRPSTFLTSSSRSMPFLAGVWLWLRPSTALM